MERLAFQRLIAVSCTAVLIMAMAGSLEAEDANVAGVELGVSYAPSGAEDPYSGPMSIGVFYSRRQLPLGLSAGVAADLSSFYSRASNYGASRMLTWNIDVGFPMTIVLHSEADVTITPQFGAGFYHRWFVFDGTSFYAARPVFSFSLSGDLVQSSGLVVGLFVSGSLFMDNAVRATGGFGQRTGVLF